MKIQISLCKYCNSSNVVKYGNYKGNQLFLCKKCNMKYTNKNTIFKMKTPIEYILLILTLKKSGMNYRGINEYMQPKYNYMVSRTAIYFWGKRFVIDDKGNLVDRYSSLDK